MILFTIKMDLLLSFTLFFYSLMLYFLSFYIDFVFIVEYALHFFEESIDEKTFDYVIVGCGTAGSLVAHQLSALETVTYIVLEAGGYGGPFLNPPAMGPLLQHSVHDWQYKTAPQENACLGYTNKMCSWPMGKIVGGSAKLNNMIHIRNYIDEMVPWFGNKYKKEDLQKYLSDIEEHDLPFNKISYQTSLGKGVLNAGIELGYDILDPNLESKIGFMEPVVNQVKGSRWSTSHTLLSHQFNNNGKILSNSFVQKIIFNEKNPNTAEGILFERFGNSFTVRAKKGLILSAGAIGTPKILLLSGIGPRDHLNDMNISVVKDLPVGENLMDHVSTGLDLVTMQNTLGFSIEDLLNPLNAWKYFVNHEGPWTSPGCEATVFINTNSLDGGNKTHEKPDLQLMVLPIGVATDYGVHLKNLIGISEHLWDNYFSKLILKNTITILPIVLHPKSRGKVYLSSKDPNDLPVINPRYFSELDDFKVILKGIDFIKMILKTQSMENLGAALNTIPLPGCENNKYDSRGYWLCYVKHLTLTTYHPVGTCKMGSTEDKATVVNYDFSVKGIKNLYVVDASIFPTMVSGNINTAVAIVAKMFSQLIFASSV